jgi:hypothetical protein
MSELEALLNQLPPFVTNQQLPGWDFRLRIVRQPDGDWIIQYITLNDDEWIVWCEHPSLLQCVTEALEQLKTAKDKAKPRKKPGLFPAD